VTPTRNIVDVKRDLFAAHFGESFAAWEVLLRALFALPMTEAQLEVYREHTGRTDPPTRPAREAWLIVGRRGGKSLIAALLAVYAALFRDYRAHLAPGERATVMVLAADKKQARTVHRYVRGFIKAVPMLEREVERETQEEIELRCGTSIEIHVSSHRTVRGYTAGLVVADEVAHWPTDVEGARSDIETVRALRPTLATIPGSMLIGVSTPYARKGVLWEAYSKHWAQDGDVLVWRATSREMNPTLDQAEVDRALEEDESAARAEYFAEFRSDVETFIPREAIAAVTIPGRHELPPSRQHTYSAFCDPSGGGGRDSFTLAIAHFEPAREQDGVHIPGKAVLDVVREARPPFSPEAVVLDFVAVLKRYGVSYVTGDRFGGTWPSERFYLHGVGYQESRQNRSELYLSLLPMLTCGRVELLDHPRLLAQLRGLERHTSRIGKDSVDHARSQHDDVANSVAGALVNAEFRSVPQFSQGDPWGI